MKITTLGIDDILIDGGTQARTSLNDATVAEYTEAILAGAEFPPVVVFYNGSASYLADGFHRYHAHRAAGLDEIDCEVRTGTKRDAVLFAVGANGTHGLRRTRDDKRRAVRMLLEDSEWGQWSDREIAKRCDVDHKTVGSIRRELAPAESSLGKFPSEKQERKFTSRHGTEATMDTAGVSTANKARAETSVATPRTQPDTAPSDGTVTEPEAVDDDVAGLLEELQADVVRLTADIAALTADDTKAELLKARRMLDHAQRQQSEAMDRAKQAADRETWVMRQLRRCGKAVNQDDPTKIAAAVEAMARDGGMKAAA